jgi:hypothetical protein
MTGPACRATMAARALPYVSLHAATVNQARATGVMEWSDFRSKGQECFNARFLR